MLDPSLEFILKCEHPASDLQFTDLLFSFASLHWIFCMQKTTDYTMVFLVFTCVSENKMHFFSQNRVQLNATVVNRIGILEAVTQQNTVSKV